MARLLSLYVFYATFHGQHGHLEGATKGATHGSVVRSAAGPEPARPVTPFVEKHFSATRAIGID